MKKKGGKKVEIYFYIIEFGDENKQGETHRKPWACSSGGMMVGRKSSMVLMAFCMTESNTHSRGRHSSSISLVEDAGKYLEKKTWTGPLKEMPKDGEGDNHEEKTYGLQLLTKAFRM